MNRYRLIRRAYERFWNHVDKNGPTLSALGPCWVWKGNISNEGYGYFSLTQRPFRAQRIAYFLLRGEIPKDRVLDHLCRNRACVNPEHLEPVVQRENILRGVGPSAQNAVKTHCDNGHELSPENTYLYTSRVGSIFRYCRICRRASDKKWRMAV